MPSKRPQLNPRTGKLTEEDLLLIQLATASGTLMLVTLWPLPLGLAWYWYAILPVLASIRIWQVLAIKK